MSFVFSSFTHIISDITTKPVINAISILKRDIKKKFNYTYEVENQIVLKEDKTMDRESFIVEVSDDVTIKAGDSLGFVYGVLYISEQFLGIKPFWFWLDQEIKKVDRIEIEYGKHFSKKPIIKYRGWFFNDEVLIAKWNIDGDSEKPWRMGFETLLRCGGNMTIPGTDKNSKKYSNLASDMGLIITHHHAEPLGAEMFLREFPGLSPNYSEHPDLFYKLWEDGVKEQKDQPTIWNVGFRGQGDTAFWHHDSSGKYDTPAKRGELISDIIKMQCDLVRQYVDSPIFCTNLYGEIMELYSQGHITLSDDIIKISGDNGFGKMVTRRQGNHNARISSLPDKMNNDEQYGIYYHVSFYDLQAANHITMLPNSVDFVNKELSQVINKQATDYWIINCSNIRPHVYYLDAIRKKWYGHDISDDKHSKDFAQEYFKGNLSIAKRLEEYPEAMISFGDEEDEHAGEQFYTENIRIIVNQFIKDRQAGASSLHWLTGDQDLNQQVQILHDLCKAGQVSMDTYYNKCKDTSKNLLGNIRQLFDGTVLLQAKIHKYCMDGVLLFAQAYNLFEEKKYKDAFIKFGYSALRFDEANQAMSDSEYGVWKGFYDNECLADINHTSFMVKKMMGIVREFGDSTAHHKWYRDAVYPLEDRYILTLLVHTNHLTDWELFLAFKEKEEKNL